MKKKKYGIRDIVKLPFKYAHGYAGLIAVQKILNGIVPTLQVLATAKFLDTAIAIVNGKRDYYEIFVPIIIVVLLLVYSWVSEQLIKFINVKFEMRLREKFRVNITEKRAKLKYKHVENSDIWNLISRVIKEPEIQIKNAYNDFLSLVALIIRILGLLLVLITHVWWTAVAIIIVSVPLFKVALKNGEDIYEADREVSKYKRKFEYLGEVLTGRECVEERTLFGYTDVINDRWQQQYETARKIEYKTDLICFARARFRGIITALISVTIVIILIKPVHAGMMSVGIFISISNGVFELIKLMSYQFTLYIEALSKNFEYLKDLSDFAMLDECEGAVDTPSDEKVIFKSLEFRNVSFKYPGKDNYILKNLSFIINEGYHYAFVGVNGAGKTTITKLITGLYDEYEGQILINGVNIKKYNHSKLKSMYSVVYQDFAKYYISFKDNIALGNINNMINEDNEAGIQASIKFMELNSVADNLSKGLDTHLGKIKSNGVDLSGGQWQRIGMARSIISCAPIRILDEPTASIDPISESNIYKQFEQISSDKTTIFISHRLGATKLANEIYVIKDGMIKEKGSHEQLMKQKGIYSYMYESQRSWYL
ncbi:ABC transporter ATP-binding protein [Abyssisolibacter fermentans]|uniref:ABC transporter ATP-binding protein n=1 Tax=Abyssisolibacter fermentans TaxID=1766203 RepID=UPI001FA7448B|nr:ABC transporter ATP-binding protein [Abyssisolibacter fermentans]